MWEYVVTNHDFGALVAFCVLAMAIVAWHGTNAWRKHQATKLEADLKLEMVSRGISAGDIERVLAAKLSSDPVSRYSQPNVKS
jgi:predicted negative regulator of RcsB-dependent stress response